MALQNERIDGRPLFEGQIDHLLPVTDSKLLRSGVFGTVGKFIAHAIIHCGIGAIGLSEAVSEYLTTEHMTSDTPITITIEDIPDMNMRATISQVGILKVKST